MITEEDVRDILREVVKTKAIDLWNHDYNFMDDALDSLDQATLALLIEERYGCNISDEELSNINSISSVVDHVNAKLGVQ